MQNRGLLKYKVHHLFFWMLVFGIWYFLRYQDYATPGIAFSVTLIKVLDLALMVYITNYVLIPQLFYRKKYFWFVLAFILMVVTSSTLKMMILGRVTGDIQMATLSGNLKSRIYDNVIPHFFLVIAGAAIKLMVDYTKLQQRMAETAREKAEAELNFLKSQINPHFLFNSLNSVYFLIDRSNTEARESLHKFSDMLRYQLYELNGAKIPVEREVTYLRDYVDLQKLRKDEHYTVEFTSSPSVKGFAIEPLLLVPFVENAFKHGTGIIEAAQIIVELKAQKGMLHFNVQNKYDPASVEIKDKTSGIGLTNVKRRLNLLYGDKQNLLISRKDNWFTVSLQLNLK